MKKACFAAEKSSPFGQPSGSGTQPWWLRWFFTAVQRKSLRGAAK